jgi:RNA polymerase sigma factor (sigma-70 family)
MENQAVSCVSSSSSSYSERLSVREKLRQITNSYAHKPVAVVTVSDETGLSVRERLNRIRDSIRGRRVSPVVVSVVVPESKKRTPIEAPIHVIQIDDSTPLEEMTQEQMAVVVARDLSGKKELSDDDRRFLHAELYRSIHKLVFQLSSKYATTSNDSSDDLAQACFVKMLKSLHRFDPSRSKLTTWTTWVCRSVLNTKYCKDKRANKVIVPSAMVGLDKNGRDIIENTPDRPSDGFRSRECRGIVAGEILEAVKELADTHPDNKPLIFEIFGNPDSEEFVMPSGVNVSEAARKLGMEYSRAYSFYSHIAKPFLQSRLVG